MTEEELKNIWQNNKQPYPIKDNQIILESSKAAFEDLERKIKLRDNRETIVAIILIPVFIAVAIRTEPLLSKIGAFLVVLSCLWIIYKLRTVKKYKQIDFTLPLIESLYHQRKYLNEEKKMLDNVLYWYIIPTAVPLQLYFVGLEQYGMAIAYLPLLGFIYYLNKYAVKKKFTPLLTKIDLEIQSLQKESEP